MLHTVRNTKNVKTLAPKEAKYMTVFVFQIVHSFCLYGNMTLKRNIYISGKGCLLARPFYGYGSKSINIDSFSQRATRAGLGHLIMSCLVVIVAIISIFCVAMSLQQSLFSVEPVLLPRNNVKDHSQDYFNQEPNLAVLHPLHICIGF